MTGPACMRCAICRRPLIRSAVPGMLLGPSCAKQRGLLPERERRIRLFTPSRQADDPRQVDWINLINSTRCGAENRKT